MLVYRSVPLAEILLGKNGPPPPFAKTALTNRQVVESESSVQRWFRVFNNKRYRKLESLAQQKWETTMGKTCVKTQVSRGKVRKTFYFYHSFLTIVFTVACIPNAKGDPHELSTMPVLTGRRGDVLHRASHWRDIWVGVTWGY